MRRYVHVLTILLKLVAVALKARLGLTNTAWSMNDFRGIKRRESARRRVVWMGITG